MVISSSCARRPPIAPLPEQAWRQPPQKIPNEQVATLGACLAAVRAATLAELAEASSVPVHDVRLTLRRLAEHLEPAGMRVFDDGSHVQLASERRSHDAVAHLAQPQQLSRLTQEQAEVLAIRPMGLMIVVSVRFVWPSNGEKFPGRITGQL